MVGLRGGNNPLGAGELHPGGEAGDLVFGPGLDVARFNEMAHQGRHAVVAQAPGVDGRRHEAAPKRVHLHQGRQVGCVAEIVGIGTLGEAGTGSRLYGDKTGLPLTSQLGPQEGESQTGEIAAAAGATNDDVGLITRLFHLLNLASEQGVSVLMTARTKPAQWRVQLPDLTSRLRSLPVATIGPPDDNLLRAVLLKQFLDRQLNVEPNVIAFLAKRMERSMDAVRRLVVTLDREALAKGRRITRQFAAEVLSRSKTGTETNAWRRENGGGRR